jgi:hypothetical protein
MKNLMFSVLLLSVLTCASGQGKYLTNAGQIKFYSHTAIEDITATHNKVGAVIDGKSGEVAIVVMMTGFQFAKKLMEEHFNENYVESEKYPKSIFNGRITNNETVDYSTTGTYKVHVKGEMTIHGKTNPLETEGTVEVTQDGIVARTKFLLNPEDYDILIPGVVRNNIAENMEITAELKCKPI